MLLLGKLLRFWLLLLRRLVLAGPFRNLQTVKDQAFHSAGTADSSISFSQGLPSLTTLGDDDFDVFTASFTR